MSGGRGSLVVARGFTRLLGACIVLDFVSILHSRALGFGVGTHIFFYDCPVVRLHQKALFTSCQYQRLVYIHQGTSVTCSTFLEDMEEIIAKPKQGLY